MFVSVRHRVNITNNDLKNRFYENLSSLRQRIVKMDNVVNMKEILFAYAGGLTTKDSNGAIYVAIDPTNPKYQKTFALHEFFGHGRPLSIESPDSKHNEDDAVLFENLAWRLLGEPDKQRDGSDHGPNAKDKIKITDYKTALPSFR